MKGSGEDFAPEITVARSGQHDFGVWVAAEQ
jgi:hypothetical protein